MGIPPGQIGSVRLGLYLLLALRSPEPEARAGPLWLWLMPVALFVSVAPLLGAPAIGSRWTRSWHCWRRWRWSRGASAGWTPRQAQDGASRWA